MGLEALAFRVSGLYLCTYANPEPGLSLYLCTLRGLGLYLSTIMRAGGGRTYVPMRFFIFTYVPACSVTWKRVKMDWPRPVEGSLILGFP